MTTSSQTFDFVVIGSGFGGSVSAMRLTEKGYRVLVLERGKRFRDEDFARTSWDLRRYVWMPLARCFGILQISPFKDVIVLHGSGVGGGSLGYANVLEVPTDELFSSPAWHHARWAIRLPIVPLETNREASLPSNAAAFSCKALTVASSP